MNRELLHFFRSLTDVDRAALKLLEGGAGSGLTDTKFQAAYDRLKAGRRLLMFRHPRFFHTVEHDHSWALEHSWVELVYVCAGRHSQLSNGARIDQQAGELLLLNQRAKHENLPCGENDIPVVFLINPRLFLEPLDAMGSENSGLHKFLRGCLHRETQEPGHMHFMVAEEPCIQSLMEHLLWSFVSGRQNSHGADQYRMGLLLLNLLERLDKADFSDSGRNDRASKVLWYIEEHYADGTLGELSRLLNCDMEWLSTDIKRLTGRTYTELQQDRRISQAKILLRATDKTIAEIANQVGYFNTSYYYRLFQKKVGCSPGDYRARTK